MDKEMSKRAIIEEAESIMKAEKWYWSPDAWTRLSELADAYGDSEKAARYRDLAERQRLSLLELAKGK